MSRDVRLLITARVTMSSARALAAVITPIYLVEIGFSATLLGALFAASAIGSAILTASVGLLSDRIGRKWFVVFLPLLVAVAGVVFAISHATALIFVFAAAGSFGRGSGAGAGQVGPYAPAEQALIAGATPQQHRNSVFGRVAFASSLGGLIGNASGVIPGVAASLGLDGPDKFAPAFLFISLLALAAALIAVPVKDNKPAHVPGTRRAKLSKPSMRFLGKLAITNSVNGLAMGFIGPFLTYWFHIRFGASSGQIGALYAVINVATMGSVLSAARFAHRFGLVRTIVVARIFQGLLLIPMVLAPTFWLAGGIYLIRMTSQRIGMPLRQSYVMAVVPEEERGTVAGLATLPSQGTSVISPVLAGYLFEHVALALPFEVGAVLQLINTGLFYKLFRHQPPPEEVSKPVRASAEVTQEPADLAGPPARVPSHGD
jgi:MFS family permease